MPSSVYPTGTGVAGILYRRDREAPGAEEVFADAPAASGDGAARRLATGLRDAHPEDKNINRAQTTQKAQ
ncbi:MAG TPA: hypothetical protein VOA64_21040 [Candidatus Dormibacteraeota bacterium]|nr:hypothetical protein [Candidatus Dormibacteraeota bacterium]